MHRRYFQYAGSLQHQQLGRQFPHTFHQFAHARGSGAPCHISPFLGDIKPTNNWTSCIHHYPANVDRLWPSLASFGFYG